MAQRQGSGRKDRDRWTGITLAGQDVENHIGRMHAVADGLGAGRLDRRQPIGKHRGEDVDHLSIAVVSVGELAPHPAGKTQSLNGAPLRKAPGLRASTGT